MPGLTYEQMVKMGAKPVDEGYTSEQLQAMGATPANADTPAAPQPPEKSFFDKAKDVAKDIAYQAPGIIGAGVGGALGTAAEPGLGTVGGGALGYAMGNQLRDSLLGKKETPMQNISKTANNLMTGAENEMGGAIVGKALPALYRGGKQLAGDAAGLVTGVKRSSISTLANRPNEVTPMIGSKASKNVADDVSNELMQLEETGGAKTQAAKEALYKQHGIDESTPLDLTKARQTMKDALVKAKVIDAEGNLTDAKFRKVDESDVPELYNLYQRLNDPDANSFGNAVDFKNEMRRMVTFSNGNPAKIRSDTGGSIIKSVQAEINAAENAKVPGLADVKTKAKEAIEVNNELAKYFSKARGEKTVGNLASGRKEDLRELMDRLGKITGKDYARKIENAIAAEDFSVGIPDNLMDISRGAQGLLAAVGAGGFHEYGAPGLAATIPAYLLTRPKYMAPVIAGAARAEQAIAPTAGRVVQTMKGSGSALGAAIRGEHLASENPSYRYDNNGKLIVDITSPNIQK